MIDNNVKISSNWIINLKNIELLQWTDASLSTHRDRYKDRGGVGIPGIKFEY